MTVNPLLGGDALAPFLDARPRPAAAGCSRWCGRRTPGRLELQDLPLAAGGLWHEEVARRVAGWAALVDASGLSALGAVVGATVPGRLAALRGLMPHQPFLVLVGRTRGRAEDLGPAFGGRPAGALVSASRSIIFAESPRRAAENLRELWAAFEAAPAST